MTHSDDIALGIVLDAVVWHGYELTDPEGVIAHTSPTAAAMCDVVATVVGGGWEAATARMEALSAAGHDVRLLYGLRDPATAISDVIDAAFEQLYVRHARHCRRMELLAELNELGTK